MIDARQHVTLPGGRFAILPANVVGVSVHHSVTSEPAPSSVEWELAHIRAIDAYHVRIGYGCFGYHIAAFESGRWYLCGDLGGARAHVKDRNHELIGVCAIGTFTDAYPRAEQMNAIANAIAYVQAFYGRELPVKGHNEWATPGNGTACAGRLNGFNWTPFLQPPATTPKPIPSEIAHAAPYLYAAVFEDNRSRLHAYDAGKLEEALRWWQGG